MPCKNRSHSHTDAPWPAEGELIIWPCERYCKYCEPHRDYHTARQLRDHVYSVHINPTKPWKRTHPKVWIRGYGGERVIRAREKAKERYVARPRRSVAQAKENETALDAPDVVPANLDVEDDSGYISNNENNGPRDATITAALPAEKMLTHRPSIRVRKLPAPTWPGNLNELRTEDWECPFAAFGEPRPRGFDGFRDPKLSNDPLYSEKDEFFVIFNAEETEKTVRAGSHASVIPSSELPDQINPSASTEPTASIGAVHDDPNEPRVTDLTEANATPSEKVVPFGTFIPCLPSNLAQEVESINNTVASTADFNSSREVTQDAEMPDADAEVEILSIRPCVKSEAFAGVQSAIQNTGTEAQLDRSREGTANHLESLSDADVERKRKLVEERLNQSRLREEQLLLSAEKARRASLR